MDRILVISTIIGFSIINMLLGKFDAKLIGKKVLIKHGINVVVYGSMIVGYYFLMSDNWWMIGALLFDRLLFFNITLSLSRKPDRKPWNYISPVRKSITDRLAFAIFGYHGTLMYATYFIIFIVLTIISLL